MRAAAIVPSLNPDEEFLSVIQNLIGVGFTRIYVVNDGSSEEYKHYFDKVAEYEECIVLTHEMNMGKGYALRTAFTCYLEDICDYFGVVTLDGDGQHSVQDAFSIVEALEQHPDSLIMGVRDFSNSNVPKKNMLGNIITRNVFRIFCGIKVSDTQTGLRGIPNSFIKTLLHVKGDRYEYETNMLLEAQNEGIEFIEVPISTIYLNENSASHFRPLWDSIRIYSLILKFALSSALSFVIDLAAFTLLNYLFSSFPTESRLLIATGLARIISGLFNFTLNKKMVFGRKSGTGKQLLKYFSLWLTNIFLSYFGTYLLTSSLHFPELLAKIPIDCFLFIFSFYLQRIWVFRTKNTNK